MIVGIPRILCVLAILLSGAAAAQPSATLLLPGTSAPTLEATNAALARIAPHADPLSANKSGAWSSGSLKITSKLVAQPLAADVVERAASASLQGFLADWRPGPHRAQLVVTLEYPTEDGDAGPYFLLVVSAIAAAADAPGVYLAPWGVLQPREVLTQAMQSKPPLVAGWIGIARTMDGQRAVFASRGMALVGLPELTLSVPLEKSAEALTLFLEKLEQAQLRKSAAPPSPWRIDLE